MASSIYDGTNDGAPSAVTPRFRFDLPGEPAPKGSRVQKTRKNGTRYTHESSKRVKPWMVAAQQALFVQSLEQGGIKIAGPINVHVVFYCARPAKPTYDWPTATGDLDKFCRALLDALTASGIISDDRHVIDLAASKRFTDGEPHAAGWVARATVEGPWAPA